MWGDELVCLVSLLGDLRYWGDGEDQVSVMNVTLIADQENTMYHCNPDISIIYNLQRKLQFRYQAQDCKLAINGP